MPKYWGASLSTSTSTNPGKISFIFGTNEEIHCEEEGTTKDPTTGEHQQVLKET
jgi:hypothetical protein